MSHLVTKKIIVPSDMLRLRGEGRARLHVVDTPKDVTWRFCAEEAWKWGNFVRRGMIVGTGLHGAATKRDGEAKRRSENNDE